MSLCCCYVVKVNRSLLKYTLFTKIKKIKREHPHSMHFNLNPTLLHSHHSLQLMDILGHPYLVMAIHSLPSLHQDLDIYTTTLHIQPHIRYWHCLLQLHVTFGCIPLGWSWSGSMNRDHLDHIASKELANPLWAWRSLAPLMYHESSDLRSWYRSSQKIAPLGKPGEDKGLKGKRGITNQYLQALYETATQCAKMNCHRSTGIDNSDLKITDEELSLK